MKDIINVVIIALAVIIVVIIGSLTFFNRAKADDIVNVTGLGSIDFEADLISWKGYFVKKDNSLERAYEKLKKDQDIIKNYLEKKDIEASELTFYSIEIQKDYRDEYTNKGDFIGTFFNGYILNQSIKIESKAIDKIESVSRSITELINQGVEFYSGSPDYFYTGLADLKINLVALATQDAKNRAQQIVKNAGGELGKIRFANMGVFQIIEANSSEDISWEGTYNTKARYKTAMLTARVQYELR